MKCIIPLAGPDFFKKEYGIKPLTKYNEDTLINFILNSRPWIYNKEILNEDLIFILKDTKESKKFENYVKKLYSGSKIVKIPETTQGALMTILSGLSIIKDFDEPIIIDLVDIIYEIKNYKSIKSMFLERNINAIIPYFKSNNNKFSYLLIDKSNKVIKAEEKNVISDNASAGTYIFKNLSILLSAINYSIKNREDVMYNNLLFVCPSVNGIIEQNSIVEPLKVKLIESLSTFFHK